MVSKYHIDLLIIGFVTNDPSFHFTSPLKRFKWHQSIMLKPLKNYFPNSFNFIQSYINRFLVIYFFEDHAYFYWQEELYSPENLKVYQKILFKLRKICEKNNIKPLFVLTPNTPAEHFIDKYNKIIPLLQETEFNYLNLYPNIKNKLGSYNRRKLWANPANGHPGDVVTSIYADEVFEYITSEEQMKLFFHGSLIQRKYFRIQ